MGAAFGLRSTARRTAEAQEPPGLSAGVVAGLLT